MGDLSGAVIAKGVEILCMQRVQIGLRLSRENDRKIGPAVLFSFTGAPA